MNVFQILTDCRKAMRELRRLQGVQPGKDLDSVIVAIESLERIEAALVTELDSLPTKGLTT
jgi:hypothetical protein